MTVDSRSRFMYVPIPDSSETGDPRSDIRLSPRLATRRKGVFGLKGGGEGGGTNIYIAEC